MQEFKYLLDKINEAEFCVHPFKYLYIEDFFSQEDFDFLLSLPVIDTRGYKSTEQMLKDLSKKTYKPVPFPGCTTDIQEYLKWFHDHNAVKTPDHTHGLTKGFGLALRLTKYENEKLQILMDFLNSEEFLHTIQTKFERLGEVTVETAVHKYTSGYEISPHPDVRKKALTYLININPEEDEYPFNNSTGLHSFKSSKKYIYDYWKNNSSIDRCWVPWDWCIKESVHSKNNSMIMFAPSNDTLHSIKLNYDHCASQRTQIYGNLWYKDRPTVKNVIWRNLPNHV
jgi:hypothetical protein